MAENYLFGGGLEETSLNPVVLIALLAAIVLTFTLPRKYVAIPFLLIGFLVPQRQTLVVGGLHLFVARIVILFGIVRVVTTRSSHSPAFSWGLTVIDKVFFCWAVSHALTFIVRYGGEGGAIVNQLAFVWDGVGAYLILRFAVKDREDIYRTARVLVLIAAVSAVTMVHEQISRNNIFGLIGGQSVPDIRLGRVRSQGPFAHAIPAGVFGATTLPLFIGLWSAGGAGLLGGVGILAATTMVATSGSSTSASAYLAGLLGLALWPLRRNMRLIRWGLLLALFGLNIAMKAPVWFAISHVDIVGGSSSYHRAMLLDQFFRHFSDWCLLGTDDNRHWGWDMWDVQNQFVSEGLRGGLITLIFFIMIVSRCLGRIGMARKAVGGDRKQQWFLWTLGAVIFAHIVAFFGSEYFDQTRFWWYTSVALACAASTPLLLERNMMHSDSSASRPTDMNDNVFIVPGCRDQTEWRAPTPSDGTVPPHVISNRL